MFGRGAFLAGLIGLGVSLLALFGSAAVPIINGPRTSWREAAIGVLPSAFLVIVFLIVMLLGLFLMLSSRQRRRQRRRRDGPDGLDERPRRRPPPDPESGER
jgi:hypothetical protein